ncbi:hypothetical protein [Amycolatopsis sp. WQ 127309]|uniref:hypothetical protein n=1 Tax=Amycolatopsis sp. WQ 127309 TaxID=2932773 RepID=UPI001FF41798|nr:hypothetical protein [Amycolatopsis sp. WQ 127309]UOZ06938.1 hypothetical protein MUY22_01185 [Amycolatopsis sp. WQ 127309]
MTDRALVVDVAELDRYAGYLSTATVPELAGIADGVERLSGGNINAFGVFVGQVLGGPCRLAMHGLSGHLRDLADDLSALVDDVRNLAVTYDRTDEENAGKMVGGNPDRAA